MVDPMELMLFGSWLAVQLKLQGITQTELAERIGVQPPQVSRIISGQRSPTVDLLISISDALRIPREETFRMAGILPPVPDVDKLVEQIIHETQDMPDQDQQEILAFIRMKNNLRTQRKKK